MKHLIVNTFCLNLRKKADAESDILAVLKKNQIVELISFHSYHYWAMVKTQSGKVGFCAFKYCLGVPDENQIRRTDYKWLKIAFGEENIEELRGPNHNKRILSYLHSCDRLNDELKKADETPWCAAFMNWCVEKAGYEGTNTAWALSWAEWGQEATNRRGRIAVFERYVMEGGVKKTYGHVGFYLGQTDDDQVIVLGGNQNNKVTVSHYPKDNDKYKFLGCRRV